MYAMHSAFCPEGTFEIHKKILISFFLFLFFLCRSLSLDWVEITSATAEYFSFGLVMYYYDILFLSGTTNETRNCDTSEFHKTNRIVSEYRFQPDIRDKTFLGFLPKWKWNVILWLDGNSAVFYKYNLHIFVAMQYLYTHKDTM